MKSRTSSRPASLFSIRGVLIVTAVLAVALACLNLIPEVFHGDFIAVLHIKDATFGWGKERSMAEVGQVEHNFNAWKEGPGEVKLITIDHPSASPKQARQGAPEAQQGGQEDQQTQQAAVSEGHPQHAQAPQQAVAATATYKSANATSSDTPAPGSLDQYHVVMSTGQGTYTHWQSRVGYYWYKKVKAEAEQQAGGALPPIGGFTRLLTGRALDGLEGEVPTVLVDSLPPELEAIAAGYVVLSRPYAFQQWARKALASLPERYIFMAEPDHILLSAPPLWATPTRPAGYPFFYIEPQKFPKIVAKFNAVNVSIDQIDPVGNAPVMIHRDQFTQIVDTWVDLAFKIKQDREADQAWGWIQEMYAYALASSQAPNGPIRYELHQELMLQPPWDASLKAANGLDAYIIHFTYGNDFDEQGKFTPGTHGAWHWDKRDYTGVYPPKAFPMPPEGCTNEAVKELIRRVNEAAASLPDWYSRTAAAAQE